MKRTTRILGVFLCLVMVLSGNVFAVSDTTIDVSTSSDGYFTVHYDQNTDRKMKVGVTFKDKTDYYDYTPESEAAYAFTKGDGRYTITLYLNVSGTSYRQITSTSAAVQMEDPLAPYLASTTEITFAENDPVGQKAAELCEGITDDASRIVAIHNYIAMHFSYDHAFAASVRSGAITNYTPDTNRVLAAQQGICYDFSALFAAMCRSQGIPCALAKGYLNGGYHAWNMVYLNDAWVAVDMTASIAYRLIWADELSDCTVSLASYSNYTY